MQMIVTDALEAAMALHAEKIGLQTGGREVNVWQMVASLIEYCDEHKIDFDLQVQTAREHLINVGEG